MLAFLGLALSKEALVELGLPVLPAGFPDEPIVKAVEPPALPARPEKLEGKLRILVVGGRLVGGRRFRTWKKIHTLKISSTFFTPFPYIALTSEFRLHRWGR